MDRRCRGLRSRPGCRRSRRPARHPARGRAVRPHPLAISSAAFTALIADQLTELRGAASAVVGSTQAVGLIVGVGTIALLDLDITAGYLVLAALIAVSGTAAALLLPDPHRDIVLPARHEPRAARWAVLRDRDFTWMRGGRFAGNVGNALGTTLLLVIAALVQAAAAALLAAVPSYPVALVAAAILGVGFGAFTSVGLALATDLLPRAEDHARDLGLVAVAANLGQLLGPIIGAGLVALAGGFWLLFACAAALSAAGALMTAQVSARHPSSPAPDPAPR